MERSSYDALVLLAALASVQIANYLDSEALELLSAFFEVLGDDLALLALRPSSSHTEGVKKAGSSQEGPGLV